MAQVALPHDIIDLTESSPPGTPTPKPSSAEPDENTEPASESASKSRKSGRKKKSDAELSLALDEYTNPPTTRHELKRKHSDVDITEQRTDSHRRRNDEPSEPTDVGAEPSAQETLEDGLFFVDVEPIIPNLPPTPAPEPVEKSNTLLLPAHVTVFGSTPVEIVAPTTSLEDDSIQFLDYDDAKVRYASLLVLKWLIIFCRSSLGTIKTLMSKSCPIELSARSAGLRMSTRPPSARSS